MAKNEKQTDDQNEDINWVFEDIDDNSVRVIDPQKNEWAGFNIFVLTPEQAKEDKRSNGEMIQRAFRSDNNFKLAL